MKSMSARLRLKHLTTGLCLAIGLEAVALPAPPLRWVPVDLSGGGMFAPAISPAGPNLMMLNCDMSAAYLSEDGGRTWRMIHHAQLRSDTACRPAFHPTDPNIIYASAAGRLEISRDHPAGNRRIVDIHDGRQVGVGGIAADVVGGGHAVAGNLNTNEHPGARKCLGRGAA